jgi:hypothetical protein
MSIAIAIFVGRAEVGRLGRRVSTRALHYVLNQFVDWESPWRLRRSWGCRGFKVRHIVEGVDVLGEWMDNRFNVFGKLFGVFRKGFREFRKLQGRTH